MEISYFNKVKITYYALEILIY